MMVWKSNFRKITQNEEMDKEIKIIIDRYEDIYWGPKIRCFVKND